LVESTFDWGDELSRYLLGGTRSRLRPFRKNGITIRHIPVTNTACCLIQQVVEKAISETVPYIQHYCATCDYVAEGVHNRLSVLDSV